MRLASLVDTRCGVCVSTEVQALLAFRATQGLLEAKHGERVGCVLGVCEVRTLGGEWLVEVRYTPLHLSFNALS